MSSDHSPAAPGIPFRSVGGVGSLAAPVLPTLACTFRRAGKSGDPRGFWLCSASHRATSSTSTLGAGGREDPCSKRFQPWRQAIAEGKLRDVGRGRASGPRSTLSSRGVLLAGPTRKGEVAEPASTRSVFSRRPPQKPTSRGAVPRMRPGEQPRMLDRPGCESLGSDVVGEGVDLQRSSRANPGGKSSGFDGPFRCPLLLLSRFSGRWSKEGTEILFRFDSLHSVAVSTRWVELTHPRKGIVGAILSLGLTTRIFVEARLLDYALTGTTVTNTGIGGQTETTQFACTPGD